MKLSQAWLDSFYIPSAILIPVYTFVFYRLKIGSNYKSLQKCIVLLAVSNFFNIIAALC